MSEIVKGTLAAIASELVDLETPLDVLPGTVMLVFKNNRVHDILAPGKYRRFGFKLPLVGGLKGMNLSTEDVPLDVELDSVGLRGEFPLEHARISLTIRLVREDGFAALRRYATSKGVNFVELLDAALVAEVDGLLRTGLGRSSAEEIDADRTIIMQATFTGVPLLNGLFRIEEAILGSPRFHEGYYRRRDAEIGETVDAAEDRRKEKQALTRGITLEELESPELRREREQREAELTMAREQHEADLKKALIEQIPDIGRRVGGDAVEHVIRGVFGVPDSADSAALGHAGQPVSVHKIPLPPAAGPEPADGHEPRDREAWLAGPPPDLAALRSDPSLLRVWAAEDLPSRPLGISLTGRTAIVALAPRLDADAAALVSEALRRNAGVTTVIIVDGIASVEDLVMRFLCQQAPELAALVEEIRIAEMGGRFTITLFSDGTRLSPLVRPLNDPQSSVLDPLAVLLPHEVIEVRAGSSR